MAARHTTSGGLKSMKHAGMTRDQENKNFQNGIGIKNSESLPSSRYSMNMTNKGDNLQGMFRAPSESNRRLCQWKIVETA